MTIAQPAHQAALTSTSYEPPVLSVRNLAVSYLTKDGVSNAVRGLSFDVHPGSIVAVVGESGSGKSTTAQAIIGLLSDNAIRHDGEVLYRGRLISEYTEQQWQQVRGSRIALIPQDPANSLNPVATIGSHIEEVLEIHTNLSRAERKAQVIDLLAQVGIDNPERRATQYPHELSGGMKQRVLIAAAIALKPDLIIADEPTSALDVTVQKRVLDLIEQIRDTTGAAFLIITHDMAVAGDRADQVVVLHQGLVKEQGVAAAVLNDPRDPYTKELVAHVPSLHTEFKEDSTSAITNTATSSDTTTSANPAVPVANHSSPALQVTDLRVRFGNFDAVRGVSLTARTGRTHGIVGESGSGKTTVGRVIAGFQPATGGTVEYFGETITGGLPAIRGTVQLVHQNPLSSLNPKRSVGASLIEPARNFHGLSKRDAAEKAAHYLELVSLDPRLARRRPRELSGGQRQRVAIARALIAEPQIVVFDEAVSALDVLVQSQILDLIGNLQEELGLTYLFISHDLAVVRSIADDVSVLRAGELVETGTTRDIFEHPTSEYTEDLLNSIPGKTYTSGALNLGL